MSVPVITAERLGKRYALGGTPGGIGARTLRDAIAAAVRKPRRVGKSRELWALRDVSFVVGAGEILGVIGRNGAGKSTLLKLLSRITRPTEGRVRIRGRVASLLEVGTGFHMELTGRENVYLNGAVLGMPRAEIARKFDEIVAFAEVERFIDTPVKRYSTGMFMRLAFAVAAHLEADILLVDEVLAVGDAEFQKKCLGKMDEVVHAGRTVLFVSHNMGAITELCPSALLLERGGVAQIGGSADVVRAYLSAYRSASPSIAIAADQHPDTYHGTSYLRIEHIELENSYGGLFAVPWKEPIRLLLRYTAMVDMKNVVFGLRVDSATGIQLFGVDHTDEGAQPMHMFRGTHHLRVVIDNPLQAGSYIITIIAHSAVSRDILSLVPGAATMDVLDVTAAGTPYLGKYSCYTNGRANWEFVD
jgi:lipopolysaccharide transport system ATP-binding protein